MFIILPQQNSSVIKMDESDFEISDEDSSQHSDSDTSCVSLDDAVPDLQLPKTDNVLSKYERAKVIGIRADQICNNSPILVELDPKKTYNEFEIAEIELIQRKLNFTIRRHLGFGKYEDRDLNDLVLQ